MHTAFRAQRDMRLARLPPELQRQVAAYCGGAELARFETERNGKTPTNNVTARLAQWTRARLAERLLLPTLTFAPDAPAMYYRLALQSRVGDEPFEVPWPVTRSVGGGGGGGGEDAPAPNVRAIFHHRPGAPDRLEVHPPTVRYRAVATDTGELLRLLAVPGAPPPVVALNGALLWEIRDQPQLTTALLSALLRLWGERVHMWAPVEPLALTWHLLRAVRALTRGRARVVVDNLSGRRFSGTTERRLRAMAIDVVDIT